MASKSTSLPLPFVPVASASASSPARQHHRAPTLSPVHSPLGSALSSGKDGTDGGTLLASSTASTATQTSANDVQSRRGPSSRPVGDYGHSGKVAHSQQQQQQQHRVTSSRDSTHLGSHFASEPLVTARTRQLPSPELPSPLRQTAQGRMTGNGHTGSVRHTTTAEDAPVSAGLEGGSGAGGRLSSPNQRLPSVTTHYTPDSSMNLRNRPLKAATADASCLSSAPTQTAALAAEKGARRPGSRRRSHLLPSSPPPPSIAEAATSSSCSPSPPVRTSIHTFFPLTTIGSVCELFRWQLALDQHRPSSHYSATHESPPTGTHRQAYHHHANSQQAAQQRQQPAEDPHQADPNLSLLSIVLGIVESNLTSEMPLSREEDLPGTLLSSNSDDELQKGHLFHGTNGSHHHRNGSGGYSPAEAAPAPNLGTTNHHPLSPLDLPIPPVHYDTVESLLDTFTTQIQDSVDLSKYPKTTSRELIKKISDVVWSSLHRSYYKDRAHLQTLYSFVTCNRLDCYGVAYAVVAACQILGFDDVRLVMSEDHAWVVFGDDGETCEVTWHGKGNEDKCGQLVPTNTDSWLYLNGQTMTCDRFLTVATLVSAMNPSINATTPDSEELVFLQQQLLWILYDAGHLKRYPMALGNLGDLEDICSPRMPRKEPMQLFGEAIESAKKYYADSHVYPYTYMGGYCFRLGRFKDALSYWALASQVMRKFNYSRDDEEIYKEFQEIANDLIPNIVKHVSSKHLEPSNLPSRVPLLSDPECFAALLRFYDGLCCWEEGASTPVLHIGWTKPLVATIGKFPHSTRSQVAIKMNYDDESDYDSDIEDDDHLSEDGTRAHHLTTIGERRRRRAASVSSTTHGEEVNGGENGAHTRLNMSSLNPMKGVKRSAVKLEKETDIREILLDHHQLATSPGADSKAWKRAHLGEGELDSEDEVSLKTVALLSSKKFAGLRNLLTAEKLNTSAIQLQLTAQSQVNVSKRSRNGSSKSGLTSELDFVSTTTTTLARTSSNAKRRRD